jgi:dissimilatory sulfite reductase (desulfoviridin) alpha/beta subunit
MEIHLINGFNLSCIVRELEQVGTKKNSAEKQMRKVLKSEVWAKDFKTFRICDGFTLRKSDKLDT